MKQCYVIVKALSSTNSLWFHGEIGVEKGKHANNMEPGIGVSFTDGILLAYCFFW